MRRQRANPAWLLVSDRAVAIRTYARLQANAGSGQSEGPSANGMARRKHLLSRSYA